MIYFVSCNGFIKIGVSGSPQKRIASMQSGNPAPIETLAIVDGGYELEAKLHQRFSALRHSGEWFRDSEEIREAIANLSRISIITADPTDNDNWRFEIKRKPREATRKNSGSTAGRKWYYWVVRVHSDGRSLYYGTLDAIGIKA